MIPLALRSQPRPLDSQHKMKKPVRERYNAKARRSSVGGSSHKNKRSLRQREADAYDSNTQLIVPGSQEDLQRKQAEQQRRELLESSGQDASAPMSSKKRKRLDAYIASRLKKEERVKIMQKLAQTSAEVDRTTLKSAATLGTGRAKTMEERIDTAGQKADRSAKRRRKTMNGAAMQIEEDDDDADLDDIHHNKAYSDVDDDQDEGNFTPPEDVEDHGPVGEVEQDPARRARIIAAASLFDKSKQPAATTTASSTSAPVLGSALAPTLAKDANGNPIMPAMRKRTKKPKTTRRINAATRLQQAGESDSSFDSSQSESDFVAASASRSRLIEKDVIGPAPRASLSRKNQEKRMAQEQGQQQQVDVKGNAKAAVSGPRWNQQDSDDEKDAAPLDRDIVDDETVDQDDSDVGSEEPDTDQDEEAVFLEAMRRRRLLPSGASSINEAHASSSANSSECKSKDDATQVEQEDSKDDEGEQDESDDDTSDSDQVVDNEEDLDDDGEDDDDDDDEEATEEYRSRRRGISTTKRSSGFKDWAHAALGIRGSAGPAAAKNESADGGEEDDTAYNLEPVAGFKIKVGDIMPKDGVARGPLGRDEENVRERSAFAAKHYAELEAAVASEKAQGKPESNDVASSSKPGASTASTTAPKVLTHVEVQRSEGLTVARLRLPVVAEEDTIVRTIMENAVTVICGETGSGKTTQVPQFLYEAAFGSKNSLNPGMIGVTQPRRVAAVSMAQRVASELSLPADRVSHQIRYDATVSADTAIKFMTDGVLLRELATDFLLSKYSAIMVDEAHERSINTDVLIGVLSRVVRLREKRWLQGVADARPLRLIIMSATLRVSDFTENTTLFPIPPPVINIGARQHPVTVHFNRKTLQDYITESIKKATKIHARLPPGGILIFLTGQQEITTVCKKLEKRFGRKAIAQKNKDRERVQGKHKNRRTDNDDDDGGESKAEKVSITARDGDVEAEEVDLGLDRDLAADVDDGAMADGDDPDALDTDDEAGGSDSEAEARHDDDLPDELKDDTDVPMHILPLYSLLPSEKQMRIFEAPPVDTRLVVVATNVAETSLTIPNIRYVIDCGRSKERKYDLISGVQSYQVSWISKASASQRAGRAGRTGPGHCYRLYSSAVYEDHLTQFSSPEILRTPVDGLVLSMKAMNIDNVANFPFPTPPDRIALKKAEQILTHLGALEAPAVASVSIGKNKRKLNHAQVTELGRTMTLFPVSPRYGKMLAQGQQHGCLPYIVAMVAALSIGDPFIREQLIEEEYGERRAKNADAEGGQGGDRDDYDRAFGKMDGDEELGSELQHLTNSEKLDQERRKARRAKYFATMRKFEALGAGLSDTFRLLSVVGAYEYAGGSLSFCDKNFLRPKAMEEIHKLRAQLCSLISSTFPDLSSSLSNPKLAPPNEAQLKVIRQLIASAYIDQVAVRADLISNESVVSSSVVNSDERTNQMLYRLRTKGGGDRMQSTRGVPYKGMGVPGFAFIHPTSSFYHTTPPSWVVFSEVQKSNSKFAKTIEEEEAGAGGTVWLKTLTKINPVWLATLGKALCTFSKPTPVAGSGELDKLKENLQAVKAGQQKAGESTRDVLVTPTYAVGSENDGMAGGLGWQLPAIKAKQKFVDGRWVLLLP